MKLLLSNDDGVFATGIRTLAHELNKKSRTVCRSARSRTQRGEPCYDADGAPARAKDAH